MSASASAGTAGTAGAAAGRGRIGLLEGALVQRLERMRLRPRVLKTTTARGERLAGKGGASTDFADYRDYVAGDDLRAVDWNAFVRLRRPYLKTFRREEDRHFVIILDASRSMSFEGKLACAKRLASALAVCALAATDRVSVWACGAFPGDRVVAPVRGRAALGRVLAAIASLGDETSGRPLADAVAAITARHQGRGTALVLSDFLSDAEPRRILGRLGALGLELLAVQVLAPSELDPDLAGDLRLVDSEDEAATLDLSTAGGVLALYHQARERLAAELAAWTGAAGGRSLTLSSQEPLEAVLARLRRDGWLA